MDYTWVLVLYQMALILMILVFPLWLIKLFAKFVRKAYREFFQLSRR